MTIVPEGSVAGRPRFAVGLVTYAAMVGETFGDQAGVVLAEYPVADYASPALALATVLSDWGGFAGACPVLRCDLWAGLAR